MANRAACERIPGMTKDQIRHALATALEPSPDNWDWEPNESRFEISAAGFWRRASRFADTEPFNPFDCNDDADRLLDSMLSGADDVRISRRPDGSIWFQRNGWDPTIGRDRREAITLAACGKIGVQYVSVED